MFVTQTLQDTDSFARPDPYQNEFTGRQVYESQGPGASDGCYTAALAKGQKYPGGSFQIQGSVWNVGGLSLNQPNTYGSDQIGFTAAGLSFYRTVLAGSLPCKATAPQVMIIENDLDGCGNQTFAKHTLTVTVNPASEVVSKDGIASTYPH
ncbi:MAG: hypothetical protein ACLP59_01280 [Bryobacteraceae bacterium]